MKLRIRGGPVHPASGLLGSLVYECADIFGKRFRNFVNRLWAQTYSLDRIIRPMSRNNMPCRIGRKRPAIPRRMNPQPVSNTNHRLRF